MSRTPVQPSVRRADARVAVSVAHVWSVKKPRPMHETWSRSIAYMSAIASPGLAIDGIDAVVVHAVAPLVVEDRRDLTGVGAALAEARSGRS